MFGSQPSPFGAAPAFGAPKPATTFGFGAPTSATPAAQPSTFGFGATPGVPAQQNTFGFGAPAQTTATTTATTAVTTQPSSFGFGAPMQPAATPAQPTTFGFGTPAQPAATTVPTSMFGLGAPTQPNPAQPSNLFGASTAAPYYIRNNLINYQKCIQSSRNCSATSNINGKRFQI